jgi:galacturan 1,4-alpha-galacturonidase
MQYTTEGNIMKNTELKNLTIAYIGGGSRGWAWGFMTDLACDGDMEGVVRLYDIDEDAARKNAVIGRMTSAHPQAKARWRYEVSPSFQSALEGADFVVISILPGTFAEMRSDVHAPEKYGVYQSVGDTAGPGGFMRSMRTVPMFSGFARAIRDYAPHAWVINYTNPMTVCMRTLYAVYPQIKAFGCCHEVFGTQKLLSAMLEDMAGIRDVPRQDIKTGVIGINHFTWINSAAYGAMDLFPLYREFAVKYQEMGFSAGRDDNWINNVFDCTHRVKFDLFLRYGLIAAAGDRHLAEFMPPWYLRSPETALAWGFTLTPVSWRENDLLARLARRERILSGQEAITLSGSGEEGHLLIKALLGLGEMVSNVNVPNRGQVTGLPEGVVVETNALFRRDEISPVFAGALPPGLDALVTRHTQNQEAIVRCALSCDRSLAVAVFMNDPQMARVDRGDGEKLFDEMMENQRQYLPAAWFA